MEIICGCHIGLTKTASNKIIFDKSCFTSTHIQGHRSILVYLASTSFLVSHQVLSIVLNLCFLGWVNSQSYLVISPGNQQVYTGILNHSLEEILSTITMVK